MLLKTTFGMGMVLVLSLATSLASASDIVYDSEFQVLVAQHGEKWAAEDKEIEIATADFKCNEGRWERYEEVQKEYEADWVAENKAALDAWKARRERVQGLAAEAAG